MESNCACSSGVSTSHAAGERSSDLRFAFRSADFGCVTRCEGSQFARRFGLSSFFNGAGAGARSDRRSGALRVREGRVEGGCGSGGGGGVDLGSFPRREAGLCVDLGGAGGDCGGAAFWRFEVGEAVALLAEPGVACVTERLRDIGGDERFESAEERGEEEQEAIWGVGYLYYLRSSPLFKGV